MSDEARTTEEASRICERVTACCGEDDRFTLEGECPCGAATGIEGYKCKQHGEVWPDGGTDYCAAAAEDPS